MLLVTFSVVGMAGGGVYRLPSAGVCSLRVHLVSAQGNHEIAAVIASVSIQAAKPECPIPGFVQELRFDLPFLPSTGLADPEVGQETVSVFHQVMTYERKLDFLTRILAR